jgi:6-phosphofructokinase 2
MIFTITANSAIDRVLYIDEFIPETNMPVEKIVNSIGGKGFDSSIVLNALGAENLAIGFVAGASGRELTGLLDRYGLKYELIWTGGETRTCHVIIEQRRHRHSHIISGALDISAESAEELLAKLEGKLKIGDWIITSGSLPQCLPPNYYRCIAEIAQAKKAHLLIDSYKGPLKEALPAHPAAVKMNRAEFSQTFGIPASSMEKLASDARRIMLSEELRTLIITCGKDGVLAFSAQKGYLGSSPPQQVVNAAGAGDAVSAALAWRFSAGDNLSDALRWAVAAGTAVILTPATAECHKEDVDRLWSQISIKEL